MDKGPRETPEHVMDDVNDQDDDSVTPFMPFTTLPDEIIEQICFYLPLQSLSLAQRLNERFYRIAGVPLIWRQHCINEYRYWHESHEFKQLLQSSALATNWRQLLASRKQQEIAAIRPAFERALSTAVGRYQAIEEVVVCGYDAKDYLLRQVDCLGLLRDSYARRYWAKVALGQIERRVALAEWMKLRNNEDVSLERALTCIDLCVLDRPPMTLDETSEYLSRVATLFVSQYDPVGYSQQTSRQRACLLVDFLKNLNLIGIGDHSHWTDIRNNLISVALLEDDHHSLPLISSVIYCTIARRVDLNASPINFPGRIHCIVSSTNDNVDLDNQYIESNTTNSETNYGDTRRYMYLDPSTNAQEITYANLCHILRLQSVPSNQFNVFVSPSSTRHMLVRTSNNMAHSVEFDRQNYSRVLTSPTTSVHLLPPTSPQINSAEVGWITPAHILSLIRMIFNPDTAAYIAYLPRVVRAVIEDQVLDRATVTSCLLTLLPNTAAGASTRNDLITELNDVYTADARPRTRKRRPSAIAREMCQDSRTREHEPLYRVGDYLRHRRYQYAGLIVGWDMRCSAAEDWIRQMGVDGLRGGREQVFYYVVDQNENTRYVAEENIEVMGVHRPDWNGVDEQGNQRVVTPDAGVARVAGKWCKRWDVNAEKFVSNVLDEYPDD